MTDASLAQTLNARGAVWSETMTERGQQGEVHSLTGRMVRGEEPAFQDFFNAYYHRLLRYLLVVTKGQEDQAREAV